MCGGVFVVSVCELGNMECLGRHAGTGMLEQAWWGRHAWAGMVGRHGVHTHGVRGAAGTTRADGGCFGHVTVLCV